MILGRQYYHCPNCGKLIYGEIAMKHVMHLICSEACRKEWERKYAAMVLGNSAEDESQ